MRNRSKQRQTFGDHTLLQAISFNQQFLIPFLAFRVILILNINDRARDGWNTFDHDIREAALQLAKSVVLVWAIHVNTKTMFAWDDGNRLWCFSAHWIGLQDPSHLLFDLQLLRIHHSPLDVVKCQFELKKKTIYSSEACFDYRPFGRA